MDRNKNPAWIWSWLCMFLSKEVLCFHMCIHIHIRNMKRNVEPTNIMFYMKLCK